MDYIQKMTDYFDSIIKSKVIVIPDNNLPQAVRKQQFRDNCKTMKSILSNIFEKEIKDKEEQAVKSGDTFDKKKIVDIGVSKIKTMVLEAENASGLES